MNIGDRVLSEYLDDEYSYLAFFSPAPSPDNPGGGRIKIFAVYKKTGWAQSHLILRLQGLSKEVYTDNPEDIEAARRAYRAVEAWIGGKDEQENKVPCDNSEGKRDCI